MACLYHLAWLPEEELNPRLPAYGPGALFLFFVLDMFIDKEQEDFKETDEDGHYYSPECLEIFLDVSSLRFFLGQILPVFYLSITRAKHGIIFWFFHFVTSLIIYLSQCRVVPHFRKMYWVRPPDTRLMYMLMLIGLLQQVSFFISTSKSFILIHILSSGKLLDSIIHFSIPFATTLRMVLDISNYKI